MKKVFLCCLICVFILCSCQLETIEDVPLNEDFKTVVSPNKLNYKADEPISIVTELQLLTNKRFTIRHGLPLIYLRVYDANNDIVLEDTLTLTISMSYTFKKKGSYNADNDRAKSIRTIELMPGTYTIEGEARFLVTDRENKQINYNIYSAPATITVSK